MIAILTITQIRPSISVEWFKPSKEQSNYINNTYDDIHVGLQNQNNINKLVNIKKGEYNRILDFIGETNIPGSALFERTEYNKKNNILQTFSIEYL
jgi:hypothetical protein